MQSTAARSSGITTCIPGSLLTQVPQSEEGSGTINATNKYCIYARHCFLKNIITEIIGQRSNNSCQPMPQPDFQQDLLGPRERWLPQASNQSKNVEPIHGNLTLQDGESSYAEGSAETRRLQLT